MAVFCTNLATRAGTAPAPPNLFAVSRTFALLIACLALVGATSATASAGSVAFAVAGSGAFDAGCLTVAGGSAAERGRWLLAFYPGQPAQTPAGSCPEDTPHVEPPVSCVTTAVVDGRNVVYLSGRDGRSYLVATVVDGGPDAPDEVAAAVVDAAEGANCGADLLSTAPVMTGGFVVLLGP